MRPRNFLSILAALLALTPSRGQVLISEFMAANESALFDGVGQPSDWIELYNPGATAVPLAGWKLRDSTGEWTFPATTLAAGGFLVVFASGQSDSAYVDPAGNLHTSFKLDAAGETLALVRPDGVISHQFAAPVPVQKTDIAYGLVQQTTQITTFDTAARILIPSGPVNDSWRSDAAFDDGSWTAGKAAAGFGSPFTGSSGTAAYRVETGTVGNQAFGGALGMDFVVNEAVQVTELGCFDSSSNGLSSTITVQLFVRNENGTPNNFGDDTGGAKLAQMVFTPADPGTAIEGSRFKPLLTALTLAPGAYTIVASGYSASEPNGNAGSGGFGNALETNGGGGKLSFVGGGRYNTNPAAYPVTLDGGPVNRYAAGTFKFAGPGDPIVRTNLQGQMQNVNASALLRVAFTVADLAAFGSLLLTLPRDDGCVVWLNGTEVARRNAPDPLEFNSAASEAGNAIETLPIANGLVAGTNLLAVHGLNASAADGDFFVGAELRAIHTDTGTVRYLVPTPGAPNPPSGVLGYVADTQFSVKRGFYDTPQTVAITTATPDATIRYALDGSPPSETVGTVYTGPLTVSTTTVLRAMAFKEGLKSTNIDTQTYLFPEDVAVQPRTAPAGYPASWTDYSNGGTYAASYGMTPSASDYAKAAGNAGFTPAQARAALANSIRALPVISIVTDKADLFDPATGIYLHPGNRGDAWERACSVELLTAGGNEEFQVDAGVHVMGLTSRSLSTTPKLNFMLVFSSQYGPSWLRHEFFGPDGPSRLKRIALRSNTRDSWLNEYYGPATYLADAFAKQAQLESGHPATRHRFAHVFLNGMYWGLYNPTERPEDHWAETTYGGENEDYDVVNLCCGNRLDAGDLVEWNALMSKSASGFASNAAYQDVQGNNSDRTRNPALKRLLGIDSMINFNINGYYTANGDWPGNFFAAYDNTQTHTDGWQFITWDNDLGFQGFNVNANKVAYDASNQWWITSPGTVDIALRGNVEYKARFADAVYRHFFHGGAYETARNKARWAALVAAIQPGLYAESARWGDYRGLPIRTVQDRWLPRVGPVATAFFNGRNAAVLGQLRSAGLYPTVNPPEYNQHGGVVAPGFGLVITGSGGTIYYTINGADPREYGGGIAPGAQPATSGTVAANLTETCIVRARINTASGWSAVNAVTFIVGNAANVGELQITEFSYHPADPTPSEFAAGFTSASDFEFIELTNRTAEPLELTGVRFAAGVEFDFTSSNMTLVAPGSSVLVVANRAAFLARYGAGLNGKVAGEFASDSKLSDNGETLSLLDHAGGMIFSLAYSDVAPWPAGADGTGASLVLQGTDSANPAHWRTSFGGATPGATTTLRDEWNRAHFTLADLTDPAVSGDLADADSDGISNLGEFGTGSDPRRGESGHNAVTVAVQPFTVGAATDNYLAVTLRRTTEPGYTITLQMSPDLATWSDAGASLVLVSTDGPRTGWQTLTYRSVEPFSSAGPARNYWRARVSRP